MTQLDLTSEEKRTKGLCMCGCGQKTRLCTYSHAARGYVKGEPMRLLPGHQHAARATGLPPPEPPNPSGLCQCGCGERTALATQTCRKLGHVKGEPKRFRQGHGSRKPGGYVVDKASGCWLWTGTTRGRGGYGVIYTGDKRYISAHRAEYERATGEKLPRDVHLHHLCATPRCVNPAHLQPVSQAEHMRLESKLSMPKAREIRKLAGSVSLKELGRRYGVSAPTIRWVIAGRTWREPPEATWVCGTFAEALAHARAVV